MREIPTETRLTYSRFWIATSATSWTVNLVSVNSPEANQGRLCAVAYAT